MRILLTIILLCCIASCKNEDVFSPGLKYIYSPEWKVWEIKLVDPANSGTENISQTRDIDSRYIFTDSIVYKSGDRGITFSRFITRHISLDSISFSSTDPGNPQRESYYIRKLFIMNDAFPPEDSLRKVRDGLFPEIEGKFLFLQLENKNKVTIENKQMTEYLLLYN